MRKDDETVAIIKPWSGGLNQYSLYITIPSKIVKRLGITENSILSIGITDDSIMTITKATNEKTKSKVSKTQNYKIESHMKEYIIEEEFKNPLDRLDNI